MACCLCTQATERRAGKTGSAKAERSRSGRRTESRGGKRDEAEEKKEKPKEKGNEKNTERFRMVLAPGLLCKAGPASQAVLRKPL